MNKRDAKIKSMAGELSIGELRDMIAKRREAGGMSKVNPIFTIERVCDIYAGALAGRDGAEKPKGTRIDVYTNREKPTGDSLTIRNILRDCAQTVKEPDHAR